MHHPGSCERQNKRNKVKYLKEVGVERAENSEQESMIESVVLIKVTLALTNWINCIHGL